MTEQELRQTLSANVKRFRKRRQWSQANLAEAVDISTNFLSEIETGKGWVSPLTLVRIADALCVEVYDLFKPEKTADVELAAVIERSIESVFSDLRASIKQSITVSVDDIKKFYEQKSPSHSNQ
jgi:transcriptional regulator with XRE-family HTH domain